MKEKPKWLIDACQEFNFNVNQVFSIYIDTHDEVWKQRHAKTYCTVTVEMMNHTMWTFPLHMEIYYL